MNNILYIRIEERDIGLWYTSWVLDYSFNGKDWETYLVARTPGEAQRMSFNLVDDLNKQHGIEFKEQRDWKWQG